MSFGYAVGDVIAIINLLERVAVEVRNYRDAPRHFQQLGAELYLVQRTLQRLLQIEPINDEDVQQIEQIRAIAIHCHQPLQAFVDKMRPSEKSLGHVQPSTTLSTIGRRLHWSLITKNDVDELRKVMMSEMVTINMLLGMQQLSTLRRLQAGADSIISSEVKQLYAQSQSFLASSTHVLNDMGKLPENFAELQAVTTEQTIKQSHASAQIIDRLDAISSSSSALVYQGNSTITTLGRLEKRVSRSISALISLALDVKEILRRLRSFSQDFTEMILANGRKLLDIHAMIKSLVRAVEAIPLHLTLPIVRLDDALGESWALPYQACRDIFSFEKILQNVVFANGRPGAGHIDLGRFVIRSNKNGEILNSHSWETSVKEGAHLTQAMIISGAKANPRKCLFTDCMGALQSDGSCCLICGRNSFLERPTTTLLKLETARGLGGEFYPRPPKQKESNIGVSGPLTIDNKILENDDMKAFRNIHLIETKAPIKSRTEAKEILIQDQCDPHANKYIAWHLLKSETASIHEIGPAIQYLKRSILYDSTQMESYYLLGRAYIMLWECSFASDGHPLTQACNAYQQAIDIDARYSTVWMSVALFFDHVKQYEDSIKAFASSVKLNPYQPLVWRNLGVLYDYRNQEEDAIEAFSRALDLGLDDSQCQARLDDLLQHRRSGAPLPKSSLQMQDFDLRTEYFGVENSS